MWIFTEFKVAGSYYNGGIFCSKQSLFFFFVWVGCTHKELDFYATMDNLRKAQSYVDNNIKMSDMKCRHKKVAGIIVKKSWVSASW